jgi:hypothetical protein
VTLATVNPLLYQGGTVLNSVKIYVDFWGVEWQAANQASVIAYIDGFFTDLGGSPWTGIMGQYCSGIANNSSSCPVGANFIKNPVGQLQGTWNDTNPVPAPPTQANISAEAAALAAHFGNPSGAVFMVYTPTGKSEAGFGTTYCAYHSWVGSFLSYGYMPYQPDAGFACGANLVDGPLDGFSIVAGHEYAEAVTDPYPSNGPTTGWLDTTLGFQGEIGDKCAWNPSPRNVTMSGHTWPVQTLFSNQGLAQGQSSCVFSLPGPTVSSIAPSQGLIGGGTSVTITGTNFVTVISVKFGSVAASTYTVNSALQIVATSPPGTGMVDITVTGANGTSSTGIGDQFTYFGVPGAPTVVAATAGNGQATVSWTAPSSNGSPITSYRLTPYIALIAQTPISVGLVGTFTVTGLTNGTTYTFTVAAINAAGSSAESNQSAAVTPATVPGQPTGVTAAGVNGQATVTWSAPIDDGGSPIVSYTVNCIPACTAIVVGGSSLQAVVTGLPNDTIIRFTVTAANIVGAGLPSNVSGPISLRSAATQSTGSPPSSRGAVQQSSPGPTPPPR